VPRAKKTLEERLAEGSFVPRLHRGMLDGGSLLADEGFRAVQDAYRRAGTEREKRALAHQLCALAAERKETPAHELARTLGFEAFCRRVLGFELAPFQRSFLDEFNRRTDDGGRVYKLGLLLLPRGSGKTFLSAALALYELLRRSEPATVLLTASSKSQAALAHRYVRNWTRASGALQASVTLTESEVRVPSTGSRMTTLAAKGASSWGETRTSSSLTNCTFGAKPLTLSCGVRW
jgi:phage terminase large subunit-like protein